MTSTNTVVRKATHTMDHTNEGKHEMADDDAFPTCVICGTPDVEDGGDHADTYGHWPQTLRGLLASLIAQHSTPNEYVQGNSDRAADAILSDPRIAVVQLPEVEPESFEEGPLHAKLPHATDRWPRAQRCHDGRIALTSINNPFRTDIEAADTAAAILAILRNTNNRGDQS